VSDELAAARLGSSNLRPQPEERSAISIAPGPSNLRRRAGQGVRQMRSYVVRCTSMASQAFSASAKVLKGDPPTLMAGLLISMARQEATKPDCP
jgi:hypothetical protein